MLFAESLGRAVLLSDGIPPTTLVIAPVGRNNKEGEITGLVKRKVAAYSRK